MNLATAHGRAQAIADGGQAGELARIIEDALAAHSVSRETDCWEALNAITVEVFDAALFQEKLNKMVADLDTGVETPERIRKDLAEFADALRVDLAHAAVQLVNAMQILERE